MLCFRAKKYKGGDIIHLLLKPAICACVRSFSMILLPLSEKPFVMKDFVAQSVHGGEDGRVTVPYVHRRDVRQESSVLHPTPVLTTTPRAQHFGRHGGLSRNRRPTLCAREIRIIFKTFILVSGCGLAHNNSRE